MCLTMVLMFCVIPVSVQAQTAYMKKMNISWDLKPDRKVKFQSYWAGIGYKDGLVTLKDYKITDAEEEGYRHLTFTVVFENSKEGFRPSEVHDLLQSDIWEKYEDTGGYYNGKYVERQRCDGRDIRCGTDRGKEI